jgi:hypothetical protein
VAPLTRARAQTFPAYSDAWRLYHAEARAVARSGFGVRSPVRFSRRRGTGERWGGWHVWESNFIHRVHVIVWPGQTLAEYLEALAHELHHAWQAEQFDGPDGWSAAVLTYWPDAVTGTSGLSERADPDGSRRDNPFEIDADAAAVRLWPLLLPCIRLRTGGTR